MEIEDSLGDLFEGTELSEGASYYQTIRLRQLIIVTTEAIENVIVRRGKYEYLRAIPGTKRPQKRTLPCCWGSMEELDAALSASREDNGNIFVCEEKEEPPKPLVNDLIIPCCPPKSLLRRNARRPNSTEARR